MNKILKISLLALLSLTMSLCFSCGGSVPNGDASVGLKVKKIDGVYTVQSYSPVKDGDKFEETVTVGTDDSGKVIGRIKSNAFSGNSTIKHLIIEESVTEIDEAAFAKMTALESITLTFVGNKKGAVDAKRCFGYLFGTEEYEGGTVVTQYYNATSSNTYYFPSTLKTVTLNAEDGYKIPDYAFNGFSKLEQITVNGAISAIGAGAFENCIFLKSFTLADSVKEIGASAFAKCLKLTSFGFGNVEKIGDKAFLATAMTEITLPDSVQEIGDFCFASDCGTGITINTESKLETITLSPSLIIGKYAFMQCVNLKTVYFTSLKKIGVGAFQYCTEFDYCGDPDDYRQRTINLAGVEKINSLAFAFFNENYSYVLWNLPENIDDNIFYKVDFFR